MLVQVSRAEESLLLLPSVETRTVVSALRDILLELGRMDVYSVAAIFGQNSFLFVHIKLWPRSGFYALMR